VVSKQKQPWQQQERPCPAREIKNLMVRKDTHGRLSTLNAQRSTTLANRWNKFIGCVCVHFMGAGKVIRKHHRQIGQLFRRESHNGAERNQRSPSRLRSDLELELETKLI